MRSWRTFLGGFQRRWSCKFSFMYVRRYQKLSPSQLETPFGYCRVFQQLLWRQNSFTKSARALFTIDVVINENEKKEKRWKFQFTVWMNFILSCTKLSEIYSRWVFLYFTGMSNFGGHVTLLRVCQGKKGMSNSYEYFNLLRHVKLIRVCHNTVGMSYLNGMSNW